MKLKILFIALLLCCAFGSTTAQDTLSQGKRLKVGLVLGGGGAKGAAEVGVLKYIEKSGIPIDYIAGTSIGSINGGLYACGYRSPQLDSMYRSQEWLTLLADRNADMEGDIIKKKDGVVYVLGFPVGRKNSKIADPSVGAIRGDSVVQLLKRMTGRTDSISFDQLPIPFRCVATDYRNNREVVLSSGVLPIAMRASMAIPGAFKAIEIDSVSLLDGGLLNNLPVDVVKAMGADVVIAVDLTQNKHEGEKRKEAPLPLKLIKNNAARLAVWAIERPDLVKYEQNRKAADVYINPDLEGFSAASFTEKDINEMIARGEKAGKAAYGKLLKLKKKIYK
ncbi:MAG: patatin-like phospholipase family protein [Prevotella sp.]